MTTKDPYAWLASAAAAYMQQGQAAPKPRLTLITPSSATPKAMKAKMKTAPDHEAKKKEIAAILKDSFNEARAETQAPPGPVNRKLSSLKLVDHVGMVHNALEAVRCLVIPSHGTGVSPGGLVDDMGLIGRNHFVDLLEIINDRLGAALEMEDAA